MRRRVKPSRAKVKAKFPVARKSLKNDGSRVRGLEKRLAEALEQQTATAEVLQTRDRELSEAQEQQTTTAEILRTIAHAQTDVQPVFDTIVRNAGRVCDAVDATLVLRKDDELTIGSHWGPIGAILGTRVLLTRGSVMGRTIVDARPIHVVDLQTTSEFPEGREFALRLGHRTTLGVPLLREGDALGALLIRRTEVRPFSEAQIAMLQAFAVQAVIAIENVRLFNETKEALEQQTATAEILRVISSSPTDVQPVFESLVASAARLCGANDLLLLVREADVLRPVAGIGSFWGSLAADFRVPLVRGSVAARSVVDATTLHFPDLAALSEAEFPAGRDLQRRFGHRTVLAVPLVREGSALGTIFALRFEVRPFADQLIALLKTFADQAVIAIENVRLFNETKEALERQTATSEILGVIASSPTDAEPVFHTIVESAVRLCGASLGAMYHYDGQLIRFGAHHGYTSAALELVHRTFPAPPEQSTFVGRAILNRQVIHVPDYDTEADIPDLLRRFYEVVGTRGSLAVPMLRKGEPIGAIVVWRGERGPFADNQIGLLQTFADQAVIAIENVRLFTELEGRNRDLTEALEQQTATGEVLRVIASSPTDLEPVLKAVIANAVRLAGAEQGHIRQYDGQLLQMVVQFNESDEFVQSIKAIQVRPTEESAVGRAFLTRRSVHIPDILVDPAYRGPAVSLQGRTVLAVPLLREGAAIGTVSMWRREVRPFTERQIELVTTFADQAVIAIENVRLFTELQASNRELTSALDTQTATSDILRVISRSQTDVQPVFDAIVQSAVRLLGAYSGALTRVDGDQIVLSALTSSNDAAADAALRAFFPHSVHSGATHAHAIRTRVPFNIADAQTDPRVHETVRAYARSLGYYSQIVVPMLRHDEAIGAIAVTRREPGGFTDDEIALLKTFADQAVIAIENVRLFNELEGRNRDLTATSEILRVISQTQTDVQPVFDTITRSAVRLCDGLFSALYRFDGELIHHVAQHDYTPEGLDEVRRTFPMRPTRALAAGRAILERAVIHIPDVELVPEYRPALARAVGARSILCVPMLREGVPAGAISVARVEPGPFSESQIELLKTFADQAVIAIENVRLFKELQARTGELTRSVEKLTALGEVSQALSSTLDVETVLSTIVSRAKQLAGTDACTVYEYDERTEEFVMRATHDLDESVATALRRAPIRRGDGAVGRVAVTREPVQIPDIALEGAYHGAFLDLLLQSGTRALLAMPLLHEDHLVGGLTVNKKTPGEFSPEVIELLKTFAAQSALAIQNARLFREIADKSAQLESASRHKSEFLANMSHELRTPLNAVIGFSEVLLQRMFGELNEKQDEYLKDIYASGQHLLSLINDILDLSKIEAGRMELEATDFDLPSAIDNALTLVRERATRRGIALGRTIDEHLGMLHGDERKVKQVLLNLLSNALKFTPEGGRIDVSARMHDGVAEVSVADTGVGIAPEDQEAVFEEFRQVGTADKKVEEHRPRAGALPEVHRAPRGPDLGGERSGKGIDLPVHVADRVIRWRASSTSRNSLEPREDTMRHAYFAAIIIAAVAAAAGAVVSAQTQPAPPRFEVDPFWPKPLPNRWLMGQAAGVAVDRQDHIWVVQRPRTLTEDEKGATLTPPRNECCVPAPSVMEFDLEGNLLLAWGGPGQGYPWPDNEHGITVDAQDNVWLAGNGTKDGMILKFTKDGKHLMTIGQPGVVGNDSDTAHMNRPSNVAVDVAASEIFVADGYSNHRVIVFDTRTGAYKRHWGANGRPPGDASVKGFGNPVHCARLSRDGLLYVCDRINDRIQVFRKDGTFVKEFVVAPDTRGNGSTWDADLSPDAAQTFLYNADGENNHVWTLLRDSGRILGFFGRSGRQAGQFHWVHNMAVDSKGNIYTTEVDNAKRAQKFVAR